MILTTTTHLGEFKHAVMICSNPKCKKMIAQYDDEALLPHPEHSKYWLYSATTRVKLVDRLGRPVQGWLDQRKLQIAVYFPNLQGGGVGYKLNSRVLPLAEDFCSDGCATTYLYDNSKNWNLCLRRDSDHVQFVADVPDTLRTQELVLHI